MTNNRLYYIQIYKFISTQKVRVYIINYNYERVHIVKNVCVHTLNKMYTLLTNTKTLFFTKKTLRFPSFTLNSSKHIHYYKALCIDIIINNMYNILYIICIIMYRHNYKAQCTSVAKK